MPEELIAQYEAPEEITTKQPITVWLEHQLAFLIFHRNLWRWQYKNVPVGMGTMSVPCQWDWHHVTNQCMKRMSEVRTLNEQQLDNLFEQLEVMECSALNALNQQFNQQCSG